MVIFLWAAGAALVGWGLFTFVTGDFVATLDIAANLVSAGAIVVALGAVVQALRNMADRLPALPERRRPAVAASVKAEPSAKKKLAIPELKLPETSAFTKEPAAAVRPSLEPPVPSPAAAPAMASAIAQAVAQKPTEPPKVELPGADPSREMIREGLVDGILYRFYADGSVEADTAEGVQRYASINEVREAILNARAPSARLPEPASTPWSDDVRPGLLYASPERREETDWSAYKETYAERGSEGLDSEELHNAAEEWKKHLEVVKRPGQYSIDQGERFEPSFQGIQETDKASVADTAYQGEEYHVQTPAFSDYVSHERHDAGLAFQPHAPLTAGEESGFEGLRHSHRGAGSDEREEWNEPFRILLRREHGRGGTRPGEVASPSNGDEEGTPT